MKLLDKTLIIAVVVVWISVVVKYESLALSSKDGANEDGHHRIRQSIRSAIHRVTDGKDDKKDSRSHESKSRIRQVVKDTVNKVADKLDKNKHKDQQHHQGDTNQPTFGFNVNDKPAAGKSSSKLDKIKDVAGAAILAKLGQKIFSSKSHKKGHNKHNPDTGHYDDYNYRPDKYRNVNGQLCTNYVEFNGIVFGKFRCPIEGYDYDATSCCGPPREQYCCKATTQAYNFADTHDYYERNHKFRKPKINMAALFLGIFIPLSCIICVVVVVVVVAVCKKKKKRSSGSKSTRDHPHEPVPTHDVDGKSIDSMSSAHSDKSKSSSEHENENEKLNAGWPQN